MGVLLQTFISELPAKALDERVLCRLPAFDKVQRHLSAKAIFHQPSDVSADWEKPQAAASRLFAPAGQTILKSAPEAFDAALGLRTVSRDVGDAELLEGAAELGGFAAAGELFFDRPVIVVTDEDAVAVAIEADRNTAAAQQAAQQAKIAASIFGGEEFGDRDFARGVVQETEQGKLRAAVLEPTVGAAIEQEHLAFTSAGDSALAMGGSTAFARRADPGRAQQAAESLTAEREMIDLSELLAEVMIVEAGVTRARELQDAFAHALGQTAGAGPAAAGVCQRRLTALPIARFQTLHMPDG